MLPHGFSSTAGGASFTGPLSSTARSYQLVIDSSQLTNLLSITLSNFSAYKDGDAAVLRWISNAEESVTHFTIERSFNGHDFAEAGIVYPETGKIGAYYQFRDEHLKNAPASGVFYRLRILEKSGELSYSHVAKVSLDLIHVMALAPNPATDLLNVRFDARQEETAHYRITNISGQEVLNGTKTCATGVNELQLEVSNLPAGLYSFWLNTASEGRTRQFLKH